MNNAVVDTVGGATGFHAEASENLQSETLPPGHEIFTIITKTWTNAPALPNHRSFSSSHRTICCLNRNISKYTDLIANDWQLFFHALVNYS